MQSDRVDSARKRFARRWNGRIVCPRELGERIEKDNYVVSHFNEPFGSPHDKLRNFDVMICRFVERRKHDLAFHALLYVGNLFRSFVDKKGYKMRFGVIFAYGIGYFFQKGGFPRFGRSDDKPSLPLAYRAE